MQAAFLIPAGIILYTVAGGLKATFIASCVHTVIIWFFLVFITEHSKTGSCHTAAVQVRAHGHHLLRAVHLLPDRLHLLPAARLPGHCAPLLLRQTRACFTCSPTLCACKCHSCHSTIMHFDPMPRGTSSLFWRGGRGGGRHRKERWALQAIRQWSRFPWTMDGGEIRVVVKREIHDASCLGAGNIVYCHSFAWQCFTGATPGHLSHKHGDDSARRHARPHDVRVMQHHGMLDLLGEQMDRYGTTCMSCRPSTRWRGTRTARTSPSSPSAASSLASSTSLEILVRTRGAGSLGAGIHLA